MYEALLKATPEYQKIAASFAQPGPAALSVCRPQAVPCCTPLCRRIWDGWSAS